MVSQSEMIPLSVVIITLNEEKRLQTCLRSLPKGSEVVVLDSGSTDQTRKIAEDSGARFQTRPFSNHAEQKNAALDLATRKWVLSIDADEVLSQELNAEIERICRQKDSRFHGFELKRRLVFMNRRLRFGKTTDRPLRLFQRGSGRFSSDIHEHVVISSGSVGKLAAAMDHYSYDDLDDYFTRFNWYTSLVAANHIKTGKSRVNLIAHVLRPWFEFVSRYIFRGGFLDGYPGYTYALLSSFYTFVKYAKFRELTRPELKPL
jgi:glycosyltransferase involved in cell wall biosynthesis